MVKAAKQRKTITALQQTEFVKIWLNRQELTTLDQQEQKQLDEEAEALAEMEGGYRQREHQQEQVQGPEVEATGIGKEGRRPWKYVKKKFQRTDGNQSRASIPSVLSLMQCQLA